MRSLQEEFFSDPKLGNHRLTDVGVSSGFGSDEPEKWVYVRARTSSRDAPLYSEGIYRVLSTTDGDPLEPGVSTTDDILDEMPRGPRRRMAVPSPHGEYLSVVEVRPDEQGDGTVEPRTGGQSSVIPVEYVIEPLTYDEVVVELIDERL